MPLVLTPPRLHQLLIRHVLVPPTTTATSAITATTTTAPRTTRRCCVLIRAWVVRFAAAARRAVCDHRTHRPINVLLRVPAARLLLLLLLLVLVLVLVMVMVMVVISRCKRCATANTRAAAGTTLQLVAIRRARACTRARGSLLLKFLLPPRHRTGARALHSRARVPSPFFLRLVTRLVLHARVLVFVLAICLPFRAPRGLCGRLAKVEGIAAVNTAISTRRDNETRRQRASNCTLLINLLVNLLINLIVIFSFIVATGVTRTTRMQPAVAPPAAAALANSRLCREVDVLLRPHLPIVDVHRQNLPGAVCLSQWKGSEDASKQRRVNAEHTHEYSRACTTKLCALGLWTHETVLQSKRERDGGRVGVILT